MSSVRCTASDRNHATDLSRRGAGIETKLVEFCFASAGADRDTQWMKLDFEITTAGRAHSRLPCDASGRPCTSDAGQAVDSKFPRLGRGPVQIQPGEFCENSSNGMKRQPSAPNTSHPARSDRAQGGFSSVASSRDALRARLGLQQAGGFGLSHCEQASGRVRAEPVGFQYFGAAFRRSDTLEYAGNGSSNASIRSVGRGILLSQSQFLMNFSGPQAA